ncbi:MAG: thioredoxin fold domain-containing protein [Bacteroidota bacterium]
MRTSLLLFILLAVGMPLRAQETVHWLTFAELEDSLAVRPKPVFIDFYTDWCTYCKKMDKVVFPHAEITELLNSKYYAVRFDAESTASVVFGGQTFINEEVGAKRRPLHQIARLLATREGQFVAPTLVFLDAEFRVTGRYFTYLGPKRFLAAATSP